MLWRSFQKTACTSLGNINNCQLTNPLIWLIGNYEQVQLYVYQSIWGHNQFQCFSSNSVWECVSYLSNNLIADNYTFHYWCQMCEENLPFESNLLGSDKKRQKLGEHEGWEIPTHQFCLLISWYIRANFLLVSLIVIDTFATCFVFFINGLKPINNWDIQTANGCQSVGVNNK